MLSSPSSSSYGAALQHNVAKKAMAVTLSSPSSSSSSFVLQRSPTKKAMATTSSPSSSFFFTAQEGAKKKGITTKLRLPSSCCFVAL